MLPVGGWVAAAVVLLVGGRALWVAGSRAPHREEIAAAFGSACLFHGCPQMDTAGTRVCYVRQDRLGRADCMLDLRTGEKQKIREQPGGIGVNIWPWAPDGRKFVYAIGEGLFVWPWPAAGSPVGGLKLGAEVTELAWLDSDHFVCVVAKNRVCHVLENQGKLELLADYLPAGGGGDISSLNAVGTNAAAWVRDNRIWRLEFSPDAPAAASPAAGAAAARGARMPNPATVWLDPQRREMGAMSYSPGAGDVLFTCAGKQNGWELWKWRSADGPDSLTLLQEASIIYHTRWVGKDRYAFVTTRAGGYCVALGSLKEPELRTIPIVTESRFSATPDGAHLVITGIASNDLAAGVWEYETETGKLKSLVPGTEHSSPAAARAVMGDGGFVWPGGEKGNFFIVHPAGYDRHAHRKYPVLIGNTTGGRPLWVDAVANCGFFVVIVNRNSWMGDIEKWADRIMALYPTLAEIPELDLDQAFLFGGSAETRYLAKLVNERPELWKGVIMLSPGALPDLAAFPLSKPVPKLLISYGDLERREEQIRRYQEEAARRGISVEAILHKGQGHVLSQVGDAVLDRTRAIVRFVSDD
jgi:hypothetical protein